MLETAAIEIVRAAVSEIAERWKTTPKLPRVSMKADEEAFANHIAYMASWASQITLRESPETREVGQVHVPLEISTTRATNRLRGRSRGRNIAAVEEVLATTNRTLLLGYPGSGKTTSVKRICSRLLADSEFVPEADFPILVRCRAVEAKSSLLEHILTLLGVALSCSYPSDWKPAKREEYRQEQLRHVVRWLLEDKHAVVLIDGLDELPLDAFRRSIGELQWLAHMLPGNAYLFVTARVGSVPAAIERLQAYWLQPLRSAQVKDLVERWLPDRAQAVEFLRQARETPYEDALDRPLNVAQLCAIFEVYGEIPSPPVLVYQRLVNLHLDEWDRERDVRRSSQYAQFGPERKRQFLAAIAYDMYRNGSAGTVTRNVLRMAYESVCSKFGLPKEEASAVVREIESHTGLFVNSGFETFEFSHKSIQEYLTADHIARSPSILSQFERWHYLPDECAIACGLSADPGEFLWSLVAATYGETWHPRTLWGIHEIFELFWIRFLTRLTVERPGLDNSTHAALALMYLDNLCWTCAGDSELMQATSVREPMIELLVECRDHYRLKRQLTAISDRAVKLETGPMYLKLNCSQMVPQCAPATMHDSIVVGQDFIDQSMLESELR